jgi:biotin transport system substrate-specific component
VFAALVAVLGAPGYISVSGLSAPVTLQTLGVMLTGSVLGARRAPLAVLTFLALVASGLPLLAGGRGGLSVFTGPTGGFLIGWLVGAAVIGWLVEHRPSRFDLGWVALANLVGGIAVVYAFGVPWMSWAATDLSLSAAWSASIVYLPGDLIKVTVTTVVVGGLLRGYPTAMPVQHRVRRDRDSVAG